MGNLVGSVQEAVRVLQRPQSALEGGQLGVAQVPSVCQAPLPAAVRVAPPVALPGEVQPARGGCSRHHEGELSSRAGSLYGEAELSSRAGSLHGKRQKKGRHEAEEGGAG